MNVSDCRYSRARESLQSKPWKLSLKTCSIYNYRTIITLASLTTYRGQNSVSILGFYSPNTIIWLGVPQASIIGLLLFLIYIQDMHCCLTKLSLCTHKIITSQTKPHYSSQAITTSRLRNMIISKHIKYYVSIILLYANLILCFCIIA